MNIIYYIGDIFGTRPYMRIFMAGPQTNCVIEKNKSTTVITHHSEERGLESKFPKQMQHSPSIPSFFRGYQPPYLNL